MTRCQPFRHRGRRRDLSALHLRPALFIEHAAGESQLGIADGQRFKILRLLNWLTFADLQIIELRQILSYAFLDQLYRFLIVKILAA